MSRTVYTFEAVGEDAASRSIEASSLDDASGQLPQGVYTTFRTYAHDRVLGLDEHLARLERSARLLTGDAAGIDLGKLRAAMRQAVERAGFVESRIRVTVIPETADSAGQAFVSVAEHAPLAPEVYELGVNLATVAAMRQTPEAKATRFLAPSRELLAHRPGDIFDYVMVDAEGRLLECLTSNWFGVLDGEVRTAGAGVLAGVTRGIVLDLASQRYAVRLEATRIGELPRLSESFLTSSSREVVPVVRIDDGPIGSGRPGPVAGQLLLSYRAYVREHAQRI